MSTLSPLYSACWKYNAIPSADPTRWESLEEWLRLYGRHHIHIALFDCWDVFSVVKMGLSSTDRWELLSAVPAIGEEHGKELFRVEKKLQRASVRNGNFNQLNTCSPQRIEKSFYHLEYNEQVPLYDPIRDGVPLNQFGEPAW